MKPMKSELLSTFDVLAPHCEVSASLCEAAGQGSLDVPLDLRTICTRAGLPQARAADVERSLIAGQIKGLFTQSTPLTWQVRDRALAAQLAPLLQGARLYRARATTHARDHLLHTKQHIVTDETLETHDPEMYSASARSDELVNLTPRNLMNPRRAVAAAVEARRRTVVQVRQDLPALATEQPHALMELHAEIERVSLQQMIDKFSEMLGKNLTERAWQQFFDQNIFILTMLFCGPVHLVCSQFHAQPSGIKGAGAQIGDYLFRGAGQVLVIVEIKKPSTSLVQKTEYRRGGGVHAPDSELSGAVSQVLYQRHSLQTTWGIHREDEVLAGTRPDNTRCVVIAGKLPTESSLLRSFETFRCAQKDVEIITFDELQQKLELLLKHLSPEP